LIRQIRIQEAAKGSAENQIVSVLSPAIAGLPLG
jgi:hypothetical protein